MLFPSQTPSSFVFAFKIFYVISQLVVHPLLRKILDPPLVKAQKRKLFNKVFSLTRPASMQIYWNKRKRLPKKRVQLPQNWFGTPTWPLWRHVKTLFCVYGWWLVGSKNEERLANILMFELFEKRNTLEPFMSKFKFSFVALIHFLYQKRGEGVLKSVNRIHLVW